MCIGPAALDPARISAEVRGRSPGSKVRLSIRVGFSEVGEDRRRRHFAVASEVDDSSGVVDAIEALVDERPYAGGLGVIGFVGLVGDQLVVGRGDRGGWPNSDMSISGISA